MTTLREADANGEVIQPETRRIETFNYNGTAVSNMWDLPTRTVIYNEILIFIKGTITVSDTSKFDISKSINPQFNIAECLRNVELSSDGGNTKIRMSGSGLVVDNLYKGGFTSVNAMTNNAFNLLTQAPSTGATTFNVEMIIPINIVSKELPIEEQLLGTLATSTLYMSNLTLNVDFNSLDKWLLPYSGSDSSVVTVNFQVTPYLKLIQLVSNLASPNFVNFMTGIPSQSGGKTVQNRHLIRYTSSQTESLPVIKDKRIAINSGDLLDDIYVITTDSTGRLVDALDTVSLRIGGAAYYNNLDVMVARFEAQRWGKFETSYFFGSLIQYKGIYRFRPSEFEGKIAYTEFGLTSDIAFVVDTNQACNLTLVTNRKKWQDMTSTINR